MCFTNQLSYVSCNVTSLNVSARSLDFHHLSFAIVALSIELVANYFKFFRENNGLNVLYLQGNYVSSFAENASISSTEEKCQ